MYKDEPASLNNGKTSSFISSFRLDIGVVCHNSCSNTLNGSRDVIIYKRINEICATNGLPKVGNHGLRHSFASLAYHLQIPEKIAMEIGGWADDGTMHKIYTHLAQKDIAKRAQDFRNFFSSANGKKCDI